jgi:DNA-binding PadR family transcriptional regulator
MRFPLLALLASGPAHGYELKQALEQRFGAVLPPLNAGQIYTTLSRLERDGLVDDDAVAQDGRPNKRVYRLTEQGRAELSGWVAEATPQTRLKDDFFIKLVLAQAAGIAEARELIDRQRGAYLQALRALDDVAAQANGDVTTTALLVEGAALHLEADLKWLDLCEQRLGVDPWSP